MASTLYVCKHCGNVIQKIVDKGVPVVCCGEPMSELVANTTDAATEKHVPVVQAEGGRLTVTVGEVEHPMLEEHHISWVWLQTELGGQRRTFKPGERPVAVFELAPGDRAVAAYEYCNLHGLWKADI